MVSFFIFTISGVAILSLTLAKRFEMKGYRIIILRAVSKGDERARDAYHKSLRFYSEGKVKFLFFVKKQLPVRVKIYTNKSVAFLQARFEERFGDIRNSRFIKKHENISDFFKSVAEIEKGAGELHEEVYSEPEEVLAYRITPVAAEEAPEALPEAESAPVEEKAEPEPVILSITEEAVVLSKPARKPRAPRKKKEKAEDTEVTFVPQMAVPAPEPVAVPIPKVRKPRVKKLPVVEVSEY